MTLEFLKRCVVANALRKTNTQLRTDTKNSRNFGPTSPHVFDCHFEVLLMVSSQFTVCCENEITDVCKALGTGSDEHHVETYEQITFLAFSNALLSSCSLSQH